MDDIDDLEKECGSKRNRRGGSKQKNKRCKSEEPPKWFKDFLEQQKDNEYMPDEEKSEENDKDDGEDDGEDDNDEDKDDGGDDKDDTEEEDDEYIPGDYFEEDTSQLRETITKHVLGAFTRDQRKALSSQVEQGVEKAFDTLKDLVNDNLDSLCGTTPTKNMWKLGMGPKGIKKYTSMLNEIRKDINNRKVTVQRILECKMDKEQKREVLKMFDILQSMELHSVEYQSYSLAINKLIEAGNRSKFTEEEMEAFSKKATELEKIISLDSPLKIRILSANVDDKRKAAIYEKYLLLVKTPDDSVTAASLEEWIEEALKTPYITMLPNPLDSETSGNCLVKLKNGFDEHLSDMEAVLEPLLTVFNNRMHNPSSESLVIGLLGSPGVGKTAVGEVIATVWGVPFQQISLGGIVDSSILDGQHPGWVGSSPGRFVKALQAMGVINGILFLDEIDKLGETREGLQVQYSLLHSTDPIQNCKFNDHYLGSRLPINLSKCLILCALNKKDGLDPALLSRMHIIKVPDYTNQQKTRIMVKHLFPKALKNVGLTKNDIQLPSDTCSCMQTLVEQNVEKEGGVRGVKACIRMIVDKLNLLLRISPEEKKQLKLTFDVNVSQKPVVITEQVVKELYKPGDIKGVWQNMYS